MAYRDFEYSSKHGNRRKRLKYKYGISVENYNWLLEEQDGKCKICGNKTDLVIDHCHKSTRVRGLLCNQCNTGLGCFKDNPDFLTCAIEYLKTQTGVEFPVSAEKIPYRVFTEPDSVRDVLLDECGIDLERTVYPSDY